MKLLNVSEGLAPLDSCCGLTSVLQNYAQGKIQLFHFILSTFELGFAMPLYDSMSITYASLSVATCYP